MMPSNITSNLHQNLLIRFHNIAFTSLVTHERTGEQPRRKHYTPDQSRLADT